MARKTTPSKSSPGKEQQSPNTTADSNILNQQIPKQYLDQTKLKKKGKLRPRSINPGLQSYSNLVNGPVMLQNTIYSNVIPTTQMALYYPPIIPSITAYDSYVDWNAFTPMQNLIYTVPLLPMVVNPVQSVTNGPYASLLGTQQLILPEIATLYGNVDANVPQTMTNVANTPSVIDVSESYVKEIQCSVYHNFEQETNESHTYPNNQDNLDPLSSYLILPKELFPSARFLNLDPNPIIDEFCRTSDLLDHVSWILDLEFGIPKAPVTRQIPVYDVQYNSVHCKNAPGAIHPGFEKCSLDFQKMFLFYYDGVISTWYNGYVTLSQDRSVANFQSWLIVPMQVLGMCWT